MKPKKILSDLIFLSLQEFSPKLFSKYVDSRKVIFMTNYFC